MAIWPHGYATTPADAQQRHVAMKHKKNTAHGDFKGYESWKSCSTIACEEARNNMRMAIKTCPECGGNGWIVHREEP